MPKFLIEVPHDKDSIACARVVKMFLTSGSHFLTNAEWGCFDGDHHCWMMVDLDDKQEALGIVPPALRAQARVVQLNRFKLDKIEDFLRQHPG